MQLTNTIPVNEYISLASKYRPSNLLQLHAQSTLSSILSYAIENNKVAHSYLLTGIRGVGKTSTARIIAKTINCTNKLKVDNVIISCEKCNNCSSFIINSHPDIIEIDAASKTSVDDIREILASCEYKPMLGTYKVFIIDEVHMLSKSAFNALLKMLEEPPVHIIFIFATTEVNKIPLTVLSRCQRYDLCRFSSNQVFDLLKEIVSKENLSFTESALKLIAFKSDGSARDAITILDQISNIAFEQNVIDDKIINSVLGLVDTALVLELTEKIINKDANFALSTLTELYHKSVNLEHLIESVAEIISYFCKKKLINTYTLHLYDNFNDKIEQLLQNLDIGNLSILWQIFDQGIKELKVSYNILIATEMLIIKAIYSQNLPSIKDIIKSNTINVSDSKDIKDNIINTSPRRFSY